MGCNYNEEHYYINDKYDIIYANKDSFIFYSSHCIVPQNILKNDKILYLYSEAFYCLKNETSVDVNMEISLKSNSLMLHSTDSCFINYFHSQNSTFYNIDQVKFNFKWDKLKIRYFSISKNNQYEVIKYRHNLSSEELLKYWIISQPDYRIGSNCQDCTLAKFYFFYNNKIVLSKEYQKLPCWYNNIE